MTYIFKQQQTPRKLNLLKLAFIIATTIYCK